MPDPACREFADDVFGLVAGDLPSDRAARFAEHARACPACATEVRRERALAARLAAMPDAPDVALPVPVVSPVRRVRWSAGVAWAAGAAAALVVALWAGERRAAGPHAFDGSAAADVAVRHAVLNVIDDASPFPAWDERLIGLTAGMETVAAARPASSR